MPPAADVDVDTPSPNPIDPAAGLVRAEMDHPDICAPTEVPRGPFGTESTPALMQSALDERTVGCTGEAAPADLDLHCLTVTVDEPCTCPGSDQQRAPTALAMNNPAAVGGTHSAIADVWDCTPGCATAVREGYSGR